MSMTREQFFQVSFTSGGRRRTEYVRAWTAAAAAQTIADLLASEGVEVTGSLEAAPAKRPQVANAAAIARAARH